MSFSGRSNSIGKITLAEKVDCNVVNGILGKAIQRWVNGVDAVL
jgi:hypothetical protein